MDKTFLRVAIPVVIIFAAVVYFTDPSPARWHSSQTSTEVGGPEASMEKETALPPATEEESLRAIINYVKAHGHLVVWLPSGQREVWTAEGDIIELDFYTGSGPLSDPPYDPGTVYVMFENQQIKFGSKNHDTQKVEWTAKDEFGFSTVLARAVKEMEKENGHDVAAPVIVPWKHPHD